MDLIYKPAQTKLLQRAAAAGCRTLNGYDMLLRQAKLQFKLFTGLDFPE
jgi:shikimate 5-dehydrogenase